MNGKVAGNVRIALECNVVDATSLWDAAAERAVQDFAMTSDDVADTIGPREDPEVEACVALLFDRLIRPSGAFDSVKIAALSPVIEIKSAPAAMTTPITVRSPAITNLSPIHAVRAA